MYGRIERVRATDPKRFAFLKRMSRMACEAATDSIRLEVKFPGLWQLSLHQTSRDAR